MKRDSFSYSSFLFVLSLYFLRYTNLKRPSRSSFSAPPLVQDTYVHFIETRDFRLSTLIFLSPPFSPLFPCPLSSLLAPKNFAICLGFFPHPFFFPGISDLN